MGDSSLATLVDKLSTCVQSQKTPGPLARTGRLGKNGLRLLGRRSGRFFGNGCGGLAHMSHDDIRRVGGANAFG